MKHFIPPLILASSIMTLSGNALAQNQATVVRSTELKAKPFSDAETLKALKENDKLNVLSRKASWTEVKTREVSGWVKMLSLRFEGADAKKTDVNALVDSGFALGKGSVTGSTTTTAVKGLDKDSFKNLSPNMDRFQKMQSLSTNKNEAKAFANQQKLNEQEQAYLSGEGDR